MIKSKTTAYFIKLIKTPAKGILIILFIVFKVEAQIPGVLKPGNYNVAAYYHPMFHLEPRLKDFESKRILEWEKVKNARPRFPNHSQPKVPFWGYEDDSNPKVMEKKIKTAVEYGIGAFIFEFYWYNDSSLFEKCLKDGFLKSANVKDIKFALMWTNHDWNEFELKSIWPASFNSTVSPESFDKMTDHIISAYFKQPNYWKINGCPYFSIYRIDKFIEGMGGRGNALRYLQRFRMKVKREGFPDVHLNIITRGLENINSENGQTQPEELAAILNFNSISSYSWLNDTYLGKFPVTPYDEVLQRVEMNWNKNAGKYKIPFYPNVTMGWDISPSSDLKSAYEFKSDMNCVLGENTPSYFKVALEKARKYLDDRKIKNKIILINSWNNWSCGSYLEPDTVFKMDYLKTIKHIFKDNNEEEIFTEE